MELKHTVIQCILADLLTESSKALVRNSWLLCCSSQLIESFGDFFFIQNQFTKGKLLLVTFYKIDEFLKNLSQHLQKIESSTQITSSSSFEFIVGWFIVGAMP